MSRRTVLALDLSTARGDIAVLRGSEVLFEAVFQSERSHNAQVFAPLQAALAVASDLDLIVIGSGPGSYTGVRIAIAAAQGVALSRNVPVIGWPSIAAPNGGQESFQVLGDARRGSFYIATVKRGHLVQPIEIVDAATAQERAAVGEWLTFDPKAPFNLPTVHAAHPSATRLATIGAGLTEEEIRARAALPVEPLYLQEAFITVARKAGKHVPLS